MPPSPLPHTALPAFAHLNNIALNGVQISAIPDAGCGLKHVREGYDPQKPLLTIDKDLVVCAATVEENAKSDPHLAEVLRAVGDFARTPRGAIMVLLVVRWGEGGGRRGGWSEYMRFLPNHVLVPTTWNDSERRLLEGTSLQTAVQAKLHILTSEFDHFQTTTSSIAWCRTHWWDTPAPVITLETWHHLDSLFRSRVLQLPLHGISLVPLLDFANHSPTANAYYSVDAAGDVILLPREGTTLNNGDEITINYGFEKSAAEFIFSYGFLPRAINSAFWLALDLHCFPDDPLSGAKEAMVRSAPMLRVIDLGGEVMWTGEFVWLMCVNEEDGLGFKVLREEDGGGKVAEVALTWEGEEVEVGKLEGVLEGGRMWEILQLRAAAAVEERVEVKLEGMAKAERGLAGIEGVSAGVKALVEKLRELERELLEKAVVTLQKQKAALLETEIVRAYLMTMEEEGGDGEWRATGDDEDDDLR